MSHLLSDEERAPIARALRQWGLDDDHVAETLSDATFGPGMVDLSPTEPGGPQHIGITVDQERDPELRELFEWRERLDDTSYGDQWATEERPPNVRVVINPHSPEALLRMPVIVLKPTRLERNFLFLIHKVAPMLAKLQAPGTAVWLAPQNMVLAEQQRAGPGSLYNALSYCLFVGATAKPLSSLEHALEHVGHAGGGPRPNRAQRRAKR